jgi:hypothetical protein
MKKTKNTKFKWRVYWYYANGAHEQGETVSRHQTYEAALKKCRNDCGFWGIEEL